MDGTVPDIPSRFKWATWETGKQVAVREKPPKPAEGAVNADA